MAELTKIMEQIKNSDLRIALLTKEIREMEAECKKRESDIEVQRIKEKQLEQDNKYKGKILQDKECELKITEGQYKIWQQILHERKEEKILQETALENLKKDIINERVQFCDKVNKFIENNDCVLYGGQKIQKALRLNEEVLKQEREINMLEYEVTSLELEKKKLQNELVKLTEMEQQRQELAEEPEKGQEFLKLKEKMKKLTLEMEELQREILNAASSKGVESSILATSPYLLTARSNWMHWSEDSSHFSPCDENLEVNHVEQHGFIPKRRSNLTHRDALKEIPYNK